jgi:hypothetical protein
MRRIILLALMIAAVSAALPQSARPAAADCAFVSVPSTYEGPQDRSLYNTTIDLAAYNMLFPGDPYFGLPAIEGGLRGSRTSSDVAVPPILLKAIAWIESVMTQADQAVPFEAIGPALVSYDCGHGIMQVTSGMTVPLGESGRPSPEQVLVATHFANNIARGAVILADKWNDAPDNLQIAGTDTNSDPAIVENWYYAVWAYNGFTGPGANKSNHPMDPIYGSWPRTSYSCGPSDDGLGHNRAEYPYQELVFGCASHPPVVGDDTLWDPLPLDLPDLNDPRWSEPLKLENFAYPFTGMVIPTARPSSAVRGITSTMGDTPTPLPTWLAGTSTATPFVQATPTATPSPTATATASATPTPLSLTAVSSRSSGVVGHRDNTPKPSTDLRATILGSPILSVSSPSMRFNVEAEDSIFEQRIIVENEGTGILSWMATPSVSWLDVSPQSGVAVGADMPCDSDAPCERSPTIAIIPDQTTMPQGTQTATVRIEAPGTNQAQTVTVTVVSVVRIGVPGVTRN